MKIDFHCHAFPTDVLRALGRFYPQDFQIDEHPDGTLHAIHSATATPAWDHPARTIEMDRVGIDVELLSCPPIYVRMDDHLPELCRLTNDAFAESCRREPGRFKAFAHLPFNDMNEALREMARCLDQLGFVGVSITSNVGGHYFDEEAFEPFWWEVNRRRTPVFLHPTNSPCYSDAFRPPVLSFPFDSTLAAARLICSGLYDRFPNVVLIVSHLGGALPFLSYRIDAGFQWPDPSQRWRGTTLPSEHMKRLYLETAQVWNRGAFHCARELVGIEHILFGTDYFLPGSPVMERMIEFLDGLDITPTERELIYSGNAMRLLNLGGAFSGQN